MAFVSIIERFRVAEWHTDSVFKGTPGEYDFAGDCDTPVRMFARGLPDPLMESDRNAVVGWMHVRCRKCEPCLGHRSNLWAARACAEIPASRRTWFGTLTMSPAEQHRLLALARVRVRRSRCEDFDQLSASDQFQERCKSAGPDLTKFLKRVRHFGRYRYLLVVEAHKSGLPHWHLLLHEYGDPLTKRTLEAQWRSGYSHWRLVNAAEPSVAFYVSKYLAKSADARVRSSASYGRPPMDMIAEAKLSAVPGSSKSAVQMLSTVPTSGGRGLGE